MTKKIISTFLSVIILFGISGTSFGTYLGSNIEVNAATDLYWPLDTNHGITNRYTTAHGGADLACAAGTPIYAVTSGTAYYYQVYKVFDGVKKLTSYGNYVSISSGSYTTIYAHMSSFNGFSLTIPSSQTKRESGNTGKISIGTKCVNEGDVIGYVGTTGNSTGNHLHFELRINGNKVNPADYVNRELSAKEHNNVPDNFPGDEDNS